MTLRRAFLWTVNTVEAASVLIVGACTLMRGFILEEPKTEKVATKRAKESNGKGAVMPP